MNLYPLLRTLCILPSAILLGTGLGSVYYALRAQHSGQLPVIAMIFHRPVTVDWLFIATTTVFRPPNGLTTVYVAGWLLAQGWLLWSLGLYMFAGLCQLPVVWLQIRVRDMAEAALRETRPIESLAYRYTNVWFILGWPAFIAFMVTFYLMINKPI